jgi:hypothetical protein
MAALPAEAEVCCMWKFIVFAVFIEVKKVSFGTWEDWSLKSDFFRPD